MAQFEDRERAFEAKFVHDDEREFRAMARRDKLLGLWAAEKLGLEGAAADDYARSVVVADLEEVGEEDVFRKIRRDFDARGVTLSDHQIRREMATLLDLARQQVRDES